MARALRIEFPGATYHVTSRGDHREPIFIDDDDRRELLAVWAQGFERFDAAALAWCFMDNHFHLVVQTRHANLSQLMRQLNGVYTQRFNRRHGSAGHLFQGRFKAILVDRDNYLLEVCRYVELNPVRAALVRDPALWPWSSYRANTGADDAPPWLDRAGLWGVMLGRDIASRVDERRAAQRYRALVASTRDVNLWEQALRQQIYLGDEQFVDAMQTRAVPTRRHSSDVPKPQRARPLTLAQWLARCGTREEAIARAVRESHLTMTSIARELGVTVSRISRLVAAWEAGGAMAKESKGNAKGKT